MDFPSFLRASGLIPREIVLGKWIRCATESKPNRRNGSYKLVDSNFGLARDWAIHTEPLIWRGDGTDIATIDRRDLARRRAQEFRLGMQARAEAQDYYRTCAQLSEPHPYLVAKGLPVYGCADFRIDPNGALIVPMRNGVQFLSLQKIRPDGEKRFWPGTSAKSARYVLDRQGATMTILCEGVATGLTLFSAIPRARVVIAFNAGNLPVVAASLRYSGLLVVAADNDHETAARIGKNPGREQAQIAAQALGCEIAYPECSGSDWNDWRAEKLAELRVSDASAYRSRRTEAQRDQLVNSMLSRQIMAHAKFRAPLDNEMR